MPTLDGWRAIAIVIVLLAHGSDSLDRAFRLGHVAVDDLKRAGLFGVQIFFGLSGFLITSRLLREEQKHGRINLGSFYIRRVFRIMPPAVGYLLVAGLLAVVGMLPLTFGRWSSALLFFANYSPAEPSWYVGHFWSLAVEEHFYLIWPTAFLLLALFRRRVFAAVSVALLLEFWRALDWKFHITHQTAAQFWGRTDVQGDHLIWGVVVALLAADKTWQPRLKRWFGSTWGALAVLTAVVLLGLHHILGIHNEHGWKEGFIADGLSGMVIPLALVATVYRPQRGFGALLELAPVRWLGRLSYSVYLWQQLFLAWNEDRVSSLTPVQAVPVNLIGVFACAVISYYVIETPLIALGQRLARAWEARRAARAADEPVPALTSAPVEPIAAASATSAFERPTLTQ